MEKDYSKLRADLHLHIYTSWRDEKWEPGPRDIKTFTIKFSEKGLDLATITNFNDDRYERFILTAHNLPKSWKFEKYERGLKIFMPNGKEFYWIKSQEIPTSEGHVLFVGLKQDQYIPPYESLEKTLNQADELTTVIADHPEAILKKGKMGLGKNNLLKYRDYFQAAEYNAGVGLIFPTANKKIEQICSEENIPLIANSDAYGVTIPLLGGFPFASIGRTYTEFDNLDLNFSDIDSILYSLKTNITKNNFTIEKTRNTFPSTLHHVCMAIGYSPLKKIGFNIQHHCDN